MSNDAPQWLRTLLRTMHERIRTAVREELASHEKSFLSGEAHHGAGDVSFQIDVRPEEIVTKTFNNAPQAVVVICEGLGRNVFPAGAGEDEAAWCVIVDPLDGSREISYKKRSAWALSGVAPARSRPTLADIVWAIQTEVPLVSQTTGLVLTASKGRPAVLESFDLTTGRIAERGAGCTRPLPPRCEADTPFSRTTSPPWPSRRSPRWKPEKAGSSGHDCPHARPIPW